MGNEERVANGERGVLILSAMKALAEQLDGTRPVSIAPTGAIGTGGLAVCDVIGYNYMDPGALAYHQAHPGKPVIGTETVSAVCTRGIYITDPTKGYVGSYDPYTTTGRASAEGVSAMPSPGSPAALFGQASIIVASPHPTSGPTSARSTASSIPAAFPRTPSSTTSPGGPISPSSICSPTGTGPAMKARRSPSGSIPISIASSSS